MKGDIKGCHRLYVSEDNYSGEYASNTLEEETGLGIRRPSSHQDGALNQGQEGWEEQ